MRFRQLCVLIAILSLTTAAFAQTDPRKLPRRLAGPGWSGGVRTPQAPITDYTPQGFANQGIGSANQGIGIGAQTLAPANQGIGNDPNLDGANPAFAAGGQGLNIPLNVPPGSAFIVDPATGGLFIQLPQTFQQPIAGAASRIGISTPGAGRDAYTPPPTIDGSASLAGRVTLETAFGDIQRGGTSPQPAGNVGGTAGRRQPATSSRRAALGVTFDDRAVNFVHVWRVAPGSPAEVAGLRQGDDIVSINGQHMTTYKDVLEFLAGRQPGDEIELAILRNGRQLHLQTTLGTEEQAFTAERTPGTRRRI